MAIEARTGSGPVTDVAARPNPWRRLVDVWRHRELLLNLVRKELKLKYKNSTLGFLWSLLNPALYLVVFYFVFQIVLGAGLPYFAIFFLAGLLPWNLFSTSLGSSTTSVVGNAGLVKKVWFPREILPLAAIGAALVHFFLQLIVLALALVIFRYPPSAEFCLLLPIALLTLLLFAAALGIGFAALNVYLRDTQHLLELVLLAWFWATPIVYQYTKISDRIGNWVLLNPMTSIVITFQRAIYNRTTYYDTTTKTTVGILPDESIWWYLRNLGIVGGCSLLLLVGALLLFGRLEDNFAEEL
ncbi:MAG: ABC transporter permease [Actinobacteria bacterium]|nr:ABC transporter permease [Actinomycetota bacterium]